MVIILKPARKEKKRQENQYFSITKKNNFDVEFTVSALSGLHEYTIDQKWPNIKYTKYIGTWKYMTSGFLNQALLH